MPCCGQKREAMKSDGRPAVRAATPPVNNVVPFPLESQEARRRKGSLPSAYAHAPTPATYGPPPAATLLATRTCDEAAQSTNEPIP
jgi:hypothetical protein